MFSCTPYKFLSKDGEIKEVYSPDNPPPASGGSDVDLSAYLKKYSEGSAIDVPNGDGAYIDYPDSGTISLRTRIDDFTWNDVTIGSSGIELYSRDRSETGGRGFVKVTTADRVIIGPELVVATSNDGQGARPITAIYYAAKLYESDYLATNNNYTIINVNERPTRTGTISMVQLIDSGSSLMSQLHAIIDVQEDKTATYAASGILDLGYNGVFLLSYITIEDRVDQFTGATAREFVFNGVGLSSPAQSKFTV